jgi:hypothetical protein
MLVSPRPDVDRKTLMTGYLDNLSDLPEWAVLRVIEEYRTGKRGDGRFVPTAAQLAQAATELRNTHIREQKRAEAEREYFEQERKARQREREFHATITDESRERVLAKLKATQEAVSKASTEMDESLKQSQRERRARYRREQNAQNALIRTQRDPDGIHHDDIGISFTGKEIARLIETYPGADIRGRLTDREAMMQAFRQRPGNPKPIILEWFKAEHAEPKSDGSLGDAAAKVEKAAATALGDDQ